jgi:hypothetical protein
MEKKPSNLARRREAEDTELVKPHLARLGIKLQ